MRGNATRDHTALQVYFFHPSWWDYRATVKISRPFEEATLKCENVNQNTRLWPDERQDQCKCRFTQEEDDPARTLTSIQPEFKRSQRRLGAGAANGRAPKVWDAAQMRWVDGAGAVRALVAKSGVAAEGQQPLFTGWGEESYDW
ncbi:hypothetical protein B0H14DRAFT_2597491 [Mycena olivaceomarginata]|nr:hypothetical protein B0H14DRAFT_2597491 [Mycena olivaceomarginata]